MKIFESFKTKQIEKENLDKAFQTIIKTITLSNSTAVLEKQLKNYVHYLSAKVGVVFEINVLEYDKKDAGKLIETDLKNNIVNINSKLFAVNSVKQFAETAKLLAGACQLLKIHQLGNYYSSKNQNGFRGEYGLHLDDINAISEFVNQNTAFDIADKNLFKLRTKAIKFLDDEESVAREFGANCQFEIFEALDQMGVLEKYFDENLEVLKYNSNRRERNTFNSYLNSLSEEYKENQILMEKIKNVAIIQHKPDILLHLADLMDVRDFYSQKCFNELKQYAKQNNNEELLSVLDNCKQNDNNKAIVAPARENIILKNKNEEKFVPRPAVKNLPKENKIKTKDGFVLEERETRTENGKEIEISVYASKRKPPIAGLSDEASDYVRGIWEKEK